MAQKYYNSEEAAKILGVTVDDVKKMLDSRELHGYRDGADWKFKVEDIDRVAEERRQEAPELSIGEEGGDVLLSEVALGQSDPGTSGTVIAMDGTGRGDAGSDIQVVGGGIDGGTTPKVPAPPKKDKPESNVAQFEDLSLSLDDDLTMEDSSPTLRNIPTIGGSGLSGSAIDLSGKGLEDDDLVLGGSGSGSDVSIGADSGISLVDPADSGLSLEQPLGLNGASADSLGLSEGDLLAEVEAAAGSAKPKGDSDFLLTPLEEAADADASESGSQVIALEESVEPAGAGELGGMAAMLDEDITAQPTLDMGMGSPLGGSPLLATQPSGLHETAPTAPAGAAVSEAPYTRWQMAGLISCAVLLMFCGMMMFDNLRNMWGWEGSYPVNSWLMDMIVGK